MKLRIYLLAAIIVFFVGCETPHMKLHTVTQECIGGLTEVDGNVLETLRAQADLNDSLLEKIRNLEANQKNIATNQADLTEAVGLFHGGGTHER